MSDDPYQPIACADYDTYEIALMRNWPVDLEWIQPTGQVITERVMPVELKIIEGAEYLFCRMADPSLMDHAPLRIRLDKIRYARIVESQ